MVDIICTCYDVKEILYQDHQYQQSNLKYPIHFITNNEDLELIKNIKSQIKNELWHFPHNSGKHKGALDMAMVSTELVTQEYVVHYHADMVFENMDLIQGMIEDLIKSDKKVAGIPRQWVFDDKGNFKDNKSIPFRSEFFIMESELYKKVFDVNNSHLYEWRCYDNGHPSLHFEPYIYAALESNNIDFQTDIHYLENVKRMKKLYGDEIIYYETRFEKTKIMRLK